MIWTNGKVEALINGAVQKLEAYQNELEAHKNIIETQNNQIEAQRLLIEAQKNSIDGLYQRLEEHSKDKNSDHWIERFGCDNILSDLQMALIEHLFPGNRKSLEAMANTHEDERCFVIGNGPSLTPEDLTTLKDNNVFSLGSNRIYLIFDKTDWRPDVWALSDLDVLTNYQEEISKLSGFTKLVAADAIFNRNIFVEEALYFPMIKTERTPRWFNKNILQGIHFFGTITCKLINIAVYMGFKEIYLLGVDNKFSTIKNENGVNVYNLKGKSHFAENYMDAVNTERKYINGFPADMGLYMDFVNKSYTDVKWFCSSFDAKVYNATRGGAVEVFERVSFDSLF